MYLAVEGICDANKAVWQELSAFVATYSDLQTRVINIQTLSQSQTHDTRGIAKDKVTGQLSNEFDAADEAITELDDLLGQLGDAKFVGDYNNARIVVDTSASHTSPAPAPAPQAKPQKQTAVTKQLTKNH